MDIVKLIKTKCLEKDITTKELERILGFSNGYIQTLKSPMRNYQRAQAIADYLDIPVSILVNYNEETPTEIDGITEKPTINALLEIVDKTHGAGASEAVKMLLELNTEDRAEIRGEMRQMLRNKA